MLFLGVFCISHAIHLRVILLIGLRVRIALLGLDQLDELLEILGHDGPVLAGALNVRDVVLVDVPLLHELCSRGADLRGVLVLLRLRSGLQVLDVLEQDLALRTGALDLADVDAVVPSELSRRRRGVRLRLLGALSKLLQVLHRDLVVGSSALEAFRDRDALGLREVFGCLRGEDRDLLLLGLLGELLGQVPLGAQQLDRCVAGRGLGLQELVDDQGEGLRGGRHSRRVVGVVAVLLVHPALSGSL